MSREMGINRIDLKWIYGGRWDIWVRYNRFVDELVTQSRLEPLSMKTVERGRAQLAAEAEIAPALSVRPLPGLLRMPHLHRGDDIFLLDDEQWRGFTSKVIDDFKERLSNVKQVSFEQLLNVADAMQGLGS